MKLSYDQEADPLCSDLNSKPRTDSREIAEGGVVNFDSTTALLTKIKRATKAA